MGKYRNNPDFHPVANSLDQKLNLHRYPQLKVKVVDGSSLVVAVFLNSVPKGTTQVLLRGSLSKVAYSIASALCQRGTQVWLVGDGLSEEEQQKAPKGTSFIPYSQFPPKKVRNDCLYHHTPAMLAPSSLGNLNSCENWLPRRAMSASRVAGIVHALEGWNVNDGHDGWVSNAAMQSTCMEAVVTFWQFPAPLPAGNIVKTNCTINGVRFARIWSEGEEVVDLVVATMAFEKEIDGEEDDDGEDCGVVCFGVNE
ncbi:hypothetical protein C3L33_08162, partial [Rhododendron williamsianum]